MALPIGPELQPVHSVPAGAGDHKTESECDGNRRPDVAYEFVLRFDQALAAPFEAFAIDVFDAASDGQSGVMTGNKFPLQRFKLLRNTQLGIFQGGSNVGPITFDFVAQFVDIGRKFGSGKRLQLLEVMSSQLFTFF